MSWASSRPGSPVSAHHTLSDFGAENVASNPATARTTLPFANVRSTQHVAQRCPRSSGHGPPAAPGDRRRRPVPRVRGRPPGARTTHPAPRPAPAPGSGCSTAAVADRRRRVQRRDAQHHAHRRRRALVCRSQEALRERGDHHRDQSASAEQAPSCATRRGGKKRGRRRGEGEGLTARTALREGRDRTSDRRLSPSERPHGGLVTPMSSSATTGQIASSPYVMDGDSTHRHGVVRNITDRTRHL